MATLYTPQGDIINVIPLNKTFETAEIEQLIDAEYHDSIIDEHNSRVMFVPSQCGQYLSKNKVASNIRRREFDGQAVYGKALLCSLKEVM